MMGNLVGSMECVGISDGCEDEDDTGVWVAVSEGNFDEVILGGTDNDIEGGVVAVTNKDTVG